MCRPQKLNGQQYVCVCVIRVIVLNSFAAVGFLGYRALSIPHSCVTSRCNSLPLGGAMYCTWFLWESYPGLPALCLNRYTEEPLSYLSAQTEITHPHIWSCLQLGWCSRGHTGSGRSRLCSRRSRGFHRWFHWGTRQYLQREAGASLAFTPSVGTVNTALIVWTKHYQSDNDGPTLSIHLEQAWAN